jgi:hypothetical protein
MQAFEQDLTGKRQSIADIIANIQTETTPFTSMIAKRTKPVNQPHSWQGEVYPDVDSKGVPDGKDVNRFDAVPRYLIQNYAQKFWRNPAVSDFSDLAEIAGATGGEMARQKAIALILLKRKIEQQCLSADDTTANAPATDPEQGYTTRGMFSWISNTAQATFPVPAPLLTPAAQIYSSTLAGFKEGTSTVGTSGFASMCASSYIQRKGPLTMDAFLGIYLKQLMSTFTTYSEQKASFDSVRQFNNGTDTKVITRTIDQLVTDTGVVRLHPSSYLRKTTTTGVDSAYTHKSGIVVDMDMVGLAYTRMPRIVPQEYKGGGPRAICDAIALLMVDNPLGLMKMEINS